MKRIALIAGVVTFLLLAAPLMGATAGLIERGGPYTMSEFIIVSLGFVPYIGINALGYLIAIACFGAVIFLVNKKINP